MEHFASLLREYDTPQVVLTREMLLHLVDKIEVHEPVGAKWRRTDEGFVVLKGSVIVKQYRVAALKTSVAFERDMRIKSVRMVF